MSRFIRGEKENADLMRVMKRVRAAVEHALEKHGEPGTDPSIQIANLTEEIGEMAKAYNELRHANVPMISSAGSHDGFYEELEQVVAYGLLILHRREGFRNIRKEILKERGTEI